MPYKKKWDSNEVDYSYYSDREPIVEIEGNIGIDFAASREMSNRHRRMELEMRKMFPPETVSDPFNPKSA